MAHATHARARTIHPLIETGETPLGFEQEVEVLRRGFLSAYGRQASAYVAREEQRAPAARGVLAEVASRLRLGSLFRPAGALAGALA